MNIKKRFNAKTLTSRYFLTDRLYFSAHVHFMWLCKFICILNVKKCLNKQIFQIWMLSERRL